MLFAADDQDQEWAAGGVSEYALSSKLDGRPNAGVEVWLGTHAHLPLALGAWRLAGGWWVSW